MVLKIDLCHDLNNALRQSAQNGHFETMQLLPDRGADVHARDNFALRESARNGHLDAVKLLLDRGADVH